jgi:hypothetical protein
LSRLAGGADGQCVNVGTNSLAGRNGEDGVAEGLALCFDEWANGDAEHGIQMFYNGEMIFEGRATCGNQEGCPPVSLFDNERWHDVELNVSPDINGGATVVFDLDRGKYGGYGILTTYSLPARPFVGFTARTGGAVNNHWIKNVRMTIGAPVRISPLVENLVPITASTSTMQMKVADFSLALDEPEGYEGVVINSCQIVDSDHDGEPDLLQLTDTGGAERGTAFKEITRLDGSPLTTSDSVTVRYSMYTGDGSGADGQCSNIGANTLGGRAGEDGVAVGFAVCFDEYANSDAEHGIQMFYNSEMIFEGRATCGNREGCPPVSLFEDEGWHDVEVNISPDGKGGATVVFDLDNGVYGGYGILPTYELPSPAYLGFTARTGGATNNHLVKDILTMVTPVITVAPSDFDLADDGNTAYAEGVNFAAVVGDVLQLTQVGPSQMGTAYKAIDGFTTSDGFTVRYSMYTGDGTGADGLCVNVGANTLGGRVGEDGVAEGLALCFDEWANGDAEHGIQMFYNSEMIFEGRATCGNREGCPPVSLFDDAQWHDVEMNISPDDKGGAAVVFNLDRGMYGGVGILATYTMPSPAYLGFTGRTGGATNNHWVKDVTMVVGGPIRTKPVLQSLVSIGSSLYGTSIVQVSEFSLEGSSLINGEVLQLTQVVNSQSGAAFRAISGLKRTDSVTISYQLYTGGGTGADGQCVSIGGNSLGGRAGEDGVSTGLALCFDEYANGADHGIQIFYNTEMIFEGRAACESTGTWNDAGTFDRNAEGCPPVSFFDTGTWHDVELNITPDGSGGATVIFSLDGGVYGGYGILATYKLPATPYLGFTARTGGANNNHWVKDVTMSLTPVLSLDVAEFELTGSARVVDDALDDTLDDVLQITQVENSQTGTAFRQIRYLSASDPVTIKYQLYTGDGSGADGQCVNLGANSLENRYGEDGVAQGIAVCFDEYANGGDHGIEIFYNGELLFEGRAQCGNREGCPPVSLFEDEKWHDIEINISPDENGGARVVFTLDRGVYGGIGLISAYTLPDQVYVGFTGRTGGATNNHWVKKITLTVGAAARSKAFMHTLVPITVHNAAIFHPVSSFDLVDDGNTAYADGVNFAAVVGDVLQLTQVGPSQMGTAYKVMDGLTASDGFTVRYAMYTGDGSGADGQCVNVGANTLGGRVGEDGVAEGLALCFDEWANEDAEHGIQMFYNGEMIFEGRATCGNREGCPPVSLFDDEQWHDVEMNIMPDGKGGATVVFDLNDGAYGGYGFLATYVLPSPAYLGFTARTGGATNNHWVKDILTLKTPVVTVAPSEFAVSGSAVVADDVLQITQLENNQMGEAYRQVHGLTKEKSFTVRYSMYTGDGTGADGQCVNIGANTLNGRVGEDGVAQGVAVCFDEWANGDAEHGIQIFYNGEMIFEGRATCGNREGCPPVSLFEDEQWHDVEVHISPEIVGAKIAFTLDRGLYTGYGVLASYKLPSPVYLGFTGRTGGATNNHWVKDITMTIGAPVEDNMFQGLVPIGGTRISETGRRIASVTQVVAVDLQNFAVSGSAVVVQSADANSVLQITQLENNQSGEAYRLAAGVTASDGFTVRYSMYSGDGSGADGLCVIFGANTLGGRAGENGVLEGLALCFDEWANGDAEHGIQMFYNGEMIFEGRATCGNREGCPPVSLFEDESWHDVEMNISPDGNGGATVVFDLDGGAYGAYGILAVYELPSPAYLGFTGRTGGATNNHWVKDVLMMVTPVNKVALQDFALSGSATLVQSADAEDVLQITQLENSQSGEAYRAATGVTASDGFTVHYQTYTGDGTGADGQCVNLGANTLGGRAGEDGVLEGLALCFDEWANGDAEHGIQIFYNGEMIFEGRATCGNREGCPPVSLFEDESWHDVELNIVPDGNGGAKVVFSLDRGLYGGIAILPSYALPSPAYLGFTGRTGGATNNHWVRNVLVTVGGGAVAKPFLHTLVPITVHNEAVAHDVSSFDLADDGDTAYAEGVNFAAVVDDVLQLTQLGNSQMGTAYKAIDGLTASDGFTVRYSMYTGDGSGADGQCVNVGANTLGGRVGEDGVAEGLALCFDEWANGDAEHGIQMFYNGEMIFEGRATCGNQEGCPPVSLFDNEQWHDVELNISPDGKGGATVVFDLDGGVYGGYGMLAPGTYVLPSPAYLGFTARTGGATNNHWVKDILTLRTPVITVAPSEFDLADDGNTAYAEGVNFAAVVGDVLQLTQVGPSQMGTAYKAIDGLTSLLSFTVRYSMYTGGGSGADGQCVNVGANTLGGRVGEDGVAVGLALCFDEYANDDAEHGIQMFYNGEMIFEGRATCGNREGCPPVSLFEDDDEQWHDVELNISPDDYGGATVVFTLDRGVYGGYGILAAYELPSPAYLGFTGRTGGATNNHWVKDISMTIGGPVTDSVLPGLVPITSAPVSLCMDLHTENNYDYNSHFHPSQLGALKAVAFTVKASNDAHLGFFDTGPGEWSGNGHEHYEVVISGWGNTQSVIRESSQGTNNAVTDTTGILSASEARPFWASALNGKIQLGIGNTLGVNVVMSWQDPDPIEVSFVSMATGWGSEGDWHVCVLEGNPTSGGDSVDFHHSTGVDVQPNLANGEFELDVPSAWHCAAECPEGVAGGPWSEHSLDDGSGHDADGYEYAEPTFWKDSEGGVVIVTQGNVPWGGLSSGSGNNYISVQGSGSHLTQTITGLVPGQQYEVSFLVASRPNVNSGTSTLHVEIDGTEIFASTHPPNEFKLEGAMFTAKANYASLRFENDSGDGDHSVFIDNVQVHVATLAETPEDLVNSDFEFDKSGIDSLQIPTGWEHKGSSLKLNDDGLNSDVLNTLAGTNEQYLVLGPQTDGQESPFIKQQIQGLAAGRTYEMRFLAAQATEDGGSMAVYVRSFRSFRFTHSPFVLRVPFIPL